jgi:hypothetical protein
VLEHERIHRWVEALKTAEFATAAAELKQQGRAAIGPLLAALERRDVELRRQAFGVLQSIVSIPMIFDPYAPETLRRQQIADLRERLERKAG